jgi:Ca2+-binding RTX toxin-like protein
MALITGSSTIDWSSIALQPVSVRVTFINVIITFVNTLTAIINGDFTPDPLNNSTSFSGTINSTGATVTMTGSGLDQLTNPSASGVINTFEYNFGPNSHVVKFTGVLDGGGSHEVFHSFSDKAFGVERTISGNILISRFGTTSGTISEVKVTTGSTEIFFQGNMVLSGAFNVGGAVTQVSVLSGGNTILMTGLSLPYSAFNSVNTIGDLFSIVGSRMPGDDIITYTNSSGTGMTFFGGAGNDTITISGPNGDTLNGGAGNDLLDGGDGNDTLIGGLGNDTFVVQNGGDSVVESPNAGIDLVQSSVNFTLGANVEHLTLAGGGDINGTGNQLGNTLIGNSGVNILMGLAGNDVLSGGAGDDTVQGGAGNDLILIADQGDHGGSEVVDGGTGTDVLRFTSTTDDQTLVLTAGVTGIEGVVIANAAGLTTGTTDLNVDASAVTSGLLMTGNAGDNELTGTALNDVLNGGAGDDTLDGRGGTNLLIGGKGDDTFIVATATDLVSEGLNGGLDTVEAAINYVLGANVENLELTEDAVTGTGNALNNVITGNGEDNFLIGNAGNDTLEGEAGADTVLGGIGNDRIVMDVAAGHVDTADGGIGLDTLALVGTVGGSGLVTVNLAAGVGDQVTDIGGAAESLIQNNFENLDASGLNGTVHATGSAGANLLIGSDGADVLNGAAGNDVLSGGAGDDIMVGGAGNDTFLFDAGDGQDVIQDNGGVADVVRFGATIDSQDLVISRQADDLRLAVAGSTDSVTIQNWYTDPVNRTETIQAGDGQTLLSAQVDVLIQAMATFTTQTGVTWETASTGGGTAEQQAAFQNIVAANWQ